MGAITIDLNIIFRAGEEVDFECITLWNKFYHKTLLFYACRKSEDD